jgi:hypothetical protein
MPVPSVGQLRDIVLPHSICVVHENYDTIEKAWGKSEIRKLKAADIN